MFYLPENAGGDWSNGVTVYQNKRADAQPVYISSYFEDGVKPNYEIKDNGDVIVYDPGQVKSATDGANIGTFNRGSKKIRYSRKAEGDSGKSKSTVNIPLLNRSQFKIYTKENAEQIISSITYNLLDFNDGTQGVIKNKGELVDIIWERLNTAPKDKQGGVALDIADEVIKRIAVKVVYDDPNNAEYVRTLDAIRTYMRGFNLEDIKGELEHRFGKNSARGIMLAWGAKTGATGVSIEEIVKKLKNLGFEIKGESDFERFEEIRKLYKEASEEVKRRIEVEEKELYYASLMRTAENIIKEEKGRFFSCSIYNGNTLKQIPGILRSALRNAREVTGGI